VELQRSNFHPLHVNEFGRRIIHDATNGDLISSLLENTEGIKFACRRRSDNVNPAEKRLRISVIPDTPDRAEASVLKLTELDESIKSKYKGKFLSNSHA
jgi:hypothetical protein